MPGSCSFKDLALTYFQYGFLTDSQRVKNHNFFPSPFKSSLFGLTETARPRQVQLELLVFFLYRQAKILLKMLNKKRMQQSIQGIYKG